MATRRPLFHNEIDFSPEEVAYSDAIRVGKVIADGVGGVALDGGGNLAENFAVPVNPDDLATKGYVDAVAQGLDPHAACVVKTDKGLGTQAVTVNTGTGTGSMTGLGGVGFTLAVNGGTPTAFTFTGSPDPTNMADVLAQINAAFTDVTATESPANNVTITSKRYGAHASLALSSVNATVTTNLGITATGSPWSGTGFIAAGTGVGKTLTSPSNGVSWNTIDGYLLTTTGQRVLVANEAGVDTVADVDNGIYTVTQLATAGLPLILTRATDADQGTPSTTEMHQGLYTYVANGTLGANTGWSVTTADPITVDTTPIVFSQFSGAPSLTYDQGLKKVVSSIQVDLDDGADAQGQGAPTASRISGLEFDVDSASGQLRVAVAPAGGLERYQTTPFGLQVKIDDSPDTLDATAAGLKVVGVPNLFKIGGSATSQTPGTGQVTATALNVVTAGPASNADSYHTHASSPATEAPVVENTMQAGVSLAVGDPVYMTTTNMRVGLGDTDTEAHAAIIGVARTAQATVGQPIEIDSEGISLATITGMGFVAGDRIWLDNGGGLTNVTPSSSGKKVVEIGFAVNTTDLFVRIIDRGKKA